MRIFLMREELFTPSQAAECLNISHQQVRVLCKSGKLFSYNLGCGQYAIYRIPASAVEKYLKLSITKPVPEPLPILKERKKKPALKSQELGYIKGVTQINADGKFEYISKEKRHASANASADRR
jgi:excisionase family DNA binding protein